MYTDSPVCAPGVLTATSVAAHAVFGDPFGFEGLAAAFGFGRFVATGGIGASNVAERRAGCRGLSLFSTGASP